MAVELQIRGRAAILTLTNPPVNGLGIAVRRGLDQQLRAAQSNPAVRFIVLRGAGRGFSGGGEIRELGTPDSSASPGLSADLHPAIERCAKPVIAALHGFAIGGGFETALACHYRIACADTSLALPEVELGILPLSGTQRLPRVLDLGTTLQLILEGHRFNAGQLRCGALFDRIVDDPQAELLAETLRFGEEIRNRRCHPLIRDRAPVTPADAAALAALRRQHAADAPAAQAAVEAIAAVYECADFDLGLGRARALYDALERSAATRAARDRFLGRRA